jgi:N-acetylglutamate synthase-like GNAT family acetyltransferase
MTKRKPEINSPLALQLSFEQLDDIQLPLVNKFYKSCRYSAKAGRGDHVFVVRSVSHGSQTIVAAVRLQLKASGFFFLRSMCVDPNYRRQGVGHYLLQQLTPFLLGKKCYCYPFTHLQSFYALVGFELIDQKNSPAFMTDPLQRYVQQGRDIVLMLKA